MLWICFEIQKGCGGRHRTQQARAGHWPQGSGLSRGAVEWKGARPAADSAHPCLPGGGRGARGEGVEPGEALCHLCLLAFHF